ncbi:MAG: hypothetical protein K6C34_03095, partial [Alphaproteobacteria bacterium]|nr:hypothetical protein [Alphaproteobacteria bacterium]
QIEVDVKRIEPVKEYPSDKNELRDVAKKESADDNYRPELKNLNCDVQSYDLILVGTPVWWGHAPKIVLSFLEKYNFTGKKVRYFVTHGGEPKNILKEMEKACKHEISELNILIHYKWLDDDKETYNKEFKSWIGKIKAETRSPNNGNIKQLTVSDKLTVSDR